jgi:hypothetical protein
MISPANPWWRGITDTINGIAFIDLCATLAFTAVTAWAVRLRMQRRLKMDLRQTVDDNNFLSIQTWMKVDEIEKKKNPCREWAPETTFIDRQTSNVERTVLQVLILRLKRTKQQSPTRRPQSWSMREKS